MNVLEKWEQEAEAFYQATGYLRPGKDVPAAMNPSDEYMEQRRLAWFAWCAARTYAELEGSNDRDD